MALNVKKFLKDLKKSQFLNKPFKHFLTRYMDITNYQMKNIFGMQQLDFSKILVDTMKRFSVTRIHTQPIH